MSMFQSSVLKNVSQDESITALYVGSVKEYTKAKKIKFADKLEERNFKNDWIALFENDKKELLELQEQINQTIKR